MRNLAPFFFVAIQILLGGAAHADDSMAILIPQQAKPGCGKYLEPVLDDALSNRIRRSLRRNTASMTLALGLINSASVPLHYLLAFRFGLLSILGDIGDHQKVVALGKAIFRDGRLDPGSDWAFFYILDSMVSLGHFSEAYENIGFLRSLQNIHANMEGRMWRLYRLEAKILFGVGRFEECRMVIDQIPIVFRTRHIRLMLAQLDNQ